ncbi:MAG: AtpZ/AtpI family protein, partial [Hymenobacter sp.]
PTPPPVPESEETLETRSSLARYSGIAVQMVAIIGLSAWAGVWLDGHFQPKTPWYTVGLTLAGVTLAMVQVIRSASQP